jgi:hypothetical protein
MLVASVDDPVLARSVDEGPAPDGITATVHRSPSQVVDEAKATPTGRAEGLGDVSHETTLSTGCSGRLGATRRHD